MTGSSKKSREGVAGKDDGGERISRILAEQGMPPGGGTMDSKTSKMHR